MAVFALTDAKLVLNSVNLSTWVTSLKVNIKVDELETTAMGATYKARIGGLKDATLDVEFNEDFAAGGPDATIFPLLGTVVAFTAKATSSANSATNPEYQGNVLVSAWDPIGNGVGELAKATVSWNITGALTRATS